MKRLIDRLTTVTTISILVWEFSLLFVPSISVMTFPIIVVMIVVTFGLMFYSDFYL